jgi:hypothetical protein
MAEETTANASPEQDSTQLGLAVIAEASATLSGDPALVDAAEENLRDTVDELIDEPLTHPQEQVVESLATASGSITAGLSGALAASQDRPVDDILGRAARLLLAKQQLASEDGTGTGEPD